MIPPDALERRFGTALPFRRFALNVTLASAGALTVLLPIYALAQPGLWRMLAEGGGPAVGLLLRQIAVNGLPTVVAATWAGAVLLDTWARGRGPWAVALADTTVRLLVVAILHAATFAVAAHAFGSFGGDRVIALRVVAPTLARAALFENLSGVYLYAVLAIALPMQVAAMRRAAPGMAPRWAWVTALLSAGALLLAFTAAMAALASSRP